MFVLFVQSAYLLFVCLLRGVAVMATDVRLSLHHPTFHSMLAAATEFSKTIGHLWPMPGFKFEKLCLL